MKNILLNIAVASATGCAALSVTGLVYRATLYWKIPVAPGDPYGLADIIELLFYFGILASSGVTMVFAFLILSINSIF